MRLPFDFAEAATKLGDRSPFLLRTLGMRFLGIVSPFNSHLKMRLQEWTEKSTRIEMNCHRGVKNHVGGIHAGAIFTLGETCAGLILVKNFSFKDFRPLMTDVSVKYKKQARGKITGVAGIPEAAVKKARAALLGGKGKSKAKAAEEFYVPMETKIFNSDGHEIAVVSTTWQIKPWKRVRIK